jgi:hypothetical protein
MNFTSLISPKKGMTTIRKRLESSLNKKVDTFKIVYQADKNDLTFFIEGETYGFADSLITTMIASYTKTYISKKQRLDLVIIDVKKDSSFDVKICYTENMFKGLITKKF